MRRLLFAVATGLAMAVPLPAPAGEEPLEITGFAAARGGWVEGQPGWLEGGFGRLWAGGDQPGDGDFHGRAEAQAALRWRPAVSWEAKLHGVARLEPSAFGGDSLGLTEAWVRYRRGVGERGELAVRGGLFFYPSSQENIDPLWGSPYTLTYSAINSWFAEEFRPLGLDAEWQVFTEGGGIASLGATAFGGNDTLGTLIAWRGWAMHDRLTGFNETLPLAPAFSLEPGAAFGADQDPDGTTPFAGDLDGRPGWALRAGYDRPGAFSAQVARVDNRGDRGLHGGEHAWRTRFVIAGGHWQVSEDFELMAEWTRGTTTMGWPGAPWVDTDFRAAYLMGSWSSPLGRWSLRHDRFFANDLIRDENWGIWDDRGQAWTLAWMIETGDHSRLGVELLALDSNRTVAAQSGASADTDGASVTVEWRLVF